MFHYTWPNATSRHYAFMQNRVRATHSKNSSASFGYLQNLLKTAKLVEPFCKKWQNNLSGNSHILLKNNGDQG